MQVSSSVTQGRRGRRLDTRRHVNHRSPLDEIHESLSWTRCKRPTPQYGLAFCDPALSRGGHNDDHRAKRRRWAVGVSTAGADRVSDRTRKAEEEISMVSRWRWASDTRENWHLSQGTGRLRSKMTQGGKTRVVPLPLSGMGSNRIESVPGIVRVRPHKRPQPGRPRRHPKVDSFRIDDRDEEAIVSSIA